MNFKEEVELENQYLMHTFARKPVEFVQGKGMELVDSEGKIYLDFLSGIGVVSLGHCHPAVVNAVTTQAQKLIHVSNYYYIEQRGEVAKMLSDFLNAEVPTAKQQPWRTFFANSGAEANECAIKVARLYAKKRAEAQGSPAASAPQTIVTLEGSFHGRTLVTLAATAQPVKQEAFQPLPGGFVATPLNDIQALEELFVNKGHQICAVLLEPIQGESGVHPCTKEFMQAVRRLTTETGALLICDEVQCGMFRTGKPYGFQQFDVVPDVVTMAKGIASGLPMGACAARGAIGEVFEPGDHGSTFGGSNIVIAAAHATLHEFDRPEFAESVNATGAFLREELAKLPNVIEVRGYGLMVGIDLSDDAPAAPDIVNAALKESLVLNATGAHTIRFLPPLICERKHIELLLEKLETLLKHL